MKTEVVHAVVLQIKPLSDYDAVITFFSETEGRLVLVAKGIRRPKAKLCGLVQPLHLLQIEQLPPKSETGMGRLIRAELLGEKRTDFPPEVFFYVELATALIREQQHHAEFFSLLRQLPQQLADANTIVIYLLKTITLFGYLPIFTHCAITGKKFTTAAKWQPTGELIALTQRPAVGIEVTFAEIKLLAFYQRAAFADCQKVTVTDETLTKIFRFLVGFLEEQGVMLKTRDLIPL